MTFRLRSLKSIVLFALLFFLQCSPENEALQVIEKSLATHGGKALWENVDQVRYTKVISLYTPEGDKEKTIFQEHSLQFAPFKATMQWEEGNSQHLACFEKNEFNYKINGQEVTDANAAASAQANLEGAYYVFWQPFRLLEPEAQLKYVGVRNLFNGKETLEIMVRYDNSPNTDQWHYFFDAASFQLVATGVRHRGRQSLITNDTYETVTGLQLNQTRTSYFTDTEFQPLYKRATYIYTVNALN